ncbi:MAG: plasmid pRiA4b ORF-3 family protein, partial [Firmicutes bacterium]|nr:plasmid pRiA4b ORF-3 family protein [Bacillota bacterium]
RGAQFIRQLFEKAVVKLTARDEKELEPFEDAFKDLFPAGTVDGAEIDALLRAAEDISPAGREGNVYIFKVLYNKKTWRRIKLFASHTLHDLHSAIQEAYNFADDHLYAFFMDGRPWSNKAYWSPFGEEPPFADDAAIGSLGLKCGQKFLYLFDFGDERRFDVQLEEILQSEIPLKQPVVIESRGEAPEQYQDWYWDDDE